MEELRKTTKYRVFSARLGTQKHYRISHMASCRTVYFLVLITLVWRSY